MCVSVHKARGKRRIAKIDHFRAIRHRQINANVHNLVALHDNHTMLHECFRVSIEHALGFKHDNLIGRVRSGSAT